VKPTSEKPPAENPHSIAPLTRALDQSEHVKNTVEQAAVDLSSVNAALKDELAEGIPLLKVESALNQSEAIEDHIQEAAAELVAVNDALAEEIDERHLLEDELSKTDAALSQSRADERRSRHSALHDEVTGLPNLTLFNDRLRNAVTQAERHGRRLAVMFIDLDDFKRINDTHGHDVGDRVLQVVARRLHAIVRGGDTVSRRSGDEFLLLMLEAKDGANVAALATRIADNVAEACDLGGVKVTVTVSIGVALYPEDGRSAQELLKHADEAMYAAKQRKTGAAPHAGAPHPRPTQNDEKEARAEREQTDESLRTERDHTNHVAAAHAHAVEAEADARSTTALDRARADAKLGAARDRADELPREVAKSRAREDESVRVTRALADEALERRHQETARMIAKLLTLERERTDRDLLTERARSDEALANRDDFLGIVSHDLRNLICGIAMTAELTAMQSGEDPRWKTAVLGAKQIQSYAARMSRLVRDLQDVASIDRGKLAINATRGDTTTLVAEVVESFRPTAAERRIALDLDVSEPAPASFDRERMLQVLSNLLTNAIKFTEEGGSVRISRERDGAMLRFSVRDTGMGIEPDDLEAIFDRFWQVGKDDRRGFGLGLYIARCIVEQHGGRIWAKSELGKGTEILFTLPAD
jgi:diguanylate cyclase (GGDEF)-like protein